MPQPEAQARVLEEWFRLPESRRLHATDAVAFAFRLLQDRPDMFARSFERAETDQATVDQARVDQAWVDQRVDHDVIVNWLLPYLNRKVN